MNYQQAIERARAVILRQHKALATEDAYTFWLRRYITAVQHMPRGLSSEKKLEHFLTDLARRHDVSASTQNQTTNHSALIILPPSPPASTNLAPSPARKIHSAWTAFVHAALLLSPHDLVQNRTLPAHASSLLIRRSTFRTPQHLA